MTATITMRALSVKQPYPDLISVGMKTVELRSRPTKHRGLVAICSSKRPTDKGPAGVVCAVVQLVDCRPAVESDRKRACVPDDYDLKGKWAYVLRLVRALDCMQKVRGQLGFYEIEISAEEALKTIQGKGDGG